MILVMTFFSLAIAAAAADFVPEDISFTAACDGTTQQYVRVLPVDFDAKVPHDVLIALHGHGSDRWQYVLSDTGSCPAARETAKKHEMIYIAPDYRAKTSWMGPKAEADLVQIIAMLKEQYTIHRVILCGGSMGGSSVLTFAVLHPDLVDGVISMNGTANHVEYANFQDAIRESFGGTKEEVPEEYRQRSAEFFPERLTMPVAITAGGQDTSVPSDSVLRLAKELEKLGREVFVIFHEDGGHSTTDEDAARAMEWVLERAKP
ncbi:MAG TPA: alpha/beta fold hydrolase [Candidatus Hydrogenedentes bacterium]|nr:alpha/beta fold hydrolase [Candidatus Hydrogenedentota bacterium]HPG66023.1 alpha/beta fold hydrolase [Candidatus Hydrogenedentota bacterium]